jgi:hypothetical protein
VNQKVLPLPGAAVHADLAAHQPNQTLADGQPEAGAAIAAGHGVVGLLEGIEQPGLGHGIDADARVTHLKADPDIVRGFFKEPGAHGNATPIGELDGVTRCRLISDLPQAQSGHHASHRWTPIGPIDLDIKLKALGAWPDRRSNDADQLLKKNAQVQRETRLFKTSAVLGFDLGDVQDVAEHATSR